jgi:AcrR family transcriptional regulator
MSPRTKEQIAGIRSESINKILVAAMELFATNGFPGTSVNAIAKKAGVSKGLIYNYFESKEDIVKGLITMMLQMADDIMDKAAAEKAVTPKQELKNLIDVFFDSIEQQMEMMRWILPLAFQISKFSFVNEMVKGKIESTIGIMQNIFERLGYEDPEQEAWFLGAIMDGLGMDVAILPDYEIDKMHKYLYIKYNIIENE